jgi:hypothetical protein
LSGTHAAARRQQTQAAHRELAAIHLGKPGRPADGRDKS